MNWRIEEAAGDEPSESGLIVVHPYANIQVIKDCSAEMLTPELKRLHIVFDSDTATPHSSVSQGYYGHAARVGVHTQVHRYPNHRAHRISLASDVRLLRETEQGMKLQYTIEQLEDVKKSLQRDIEWYQQKNRPGVNFSAGLRKERVAELITQDTEVSYVLKLLADDRFNAIVEDLIRFSCIEANLIALESMVRKISPKRSKMKQECIDLIRNILEKYFQTDTDSDAKGDKT